jgi:rubrerythrin
MGERFGSVAEAVDDPQLKKFFSELQRQEKAHSRIVDGMLETFGYKEEKK